MHGGIEQAPDIYIFESMDRNAGYAYLKNKASELPNIAQVKESGQALWLLRESNTQPGMLTADYIRWNKEKNEWVANSTRMALHSVNGWINASNPSDPIVIEAMRSINSVNAQTAGQHVQALRSYLENLPITPLLVQNRMNPPKAQQAKMGIYSHYVTSDEVNPSAAPAAARKVTVPLTQAVAQAISCELTGKPFKQPVVLNRDITIPASGGKLPIQLNKGKSYERAELERMGINPSNFYRNFVLEKIIDRLGCKDSARMENLTNDRLIDPVILDTMSNPFILPSGHSLSKESVDGMVASGRSLACPETRQPFTVNNVVHNINLDRFIKAWPECQALLVQSLRTPDARLTPKL